jgi:hypothetical protein
MVSVDIMSISAQLNPDAILGKSVWSNILLV